MKHLGGRHVAESEPAGDIGQRAALDRRLPQRLAFAVRELLEHDPDKVAISDGVFHVRWPAGIGGQRDQRLSEALPTPQQVQAVVAGDG
jgi:hypothetical protein